MIAEWGWCSWYLLPSFCSHTPLALYFLPPYPIPPSFLYILLTSHFYISFIIAFVFLLVHEVFLHGPFALTSLSTYLYFIFWVQACVNECKCACVWVHMELCVASVCLYLCGGRSFYAVPEVFWVLSRIHRHLPVKSFLDSKERKEEILCLCLLCHIRNLTVRGVWRCLPRGFKLDMAMGTLFGTEQLCVYYAVRVPEDLVTSTVGTAHVLLTMSKPLGKTYVKKVTSAPLIQDTNCILYSF